MEEYIRVAIKDIGDSDEIIELLKKYQKEIDTVICEYKNKQRTEKDKIRYFRIFSNMIQYLRTDIIDSNGKQVMPNKNAVIELVKLLGIYKVIYYGVSRNDNEFVDTTDKIIEVGYRIYKSTYAPGEFGRTGSVFTVTSAEISSKTSNVLLWNDIMGYGCIYNKNRIYDEINKLKLKHVTPQNFVYFLTLINDYPIVVTQCNIKDDSQVEEFESR
jgi:hypothetical protein